MGGRCQEVLQTLVQVFHFFHFKLVSFIFSLESEFCGSGCEEQAMNNNNDDIIITTTTTLLLLLMMMTFENEVGRKVNESNPNVNTLNHVYGQRCNTLNRVNGQRCNTFNHHARSV